MKLCILWLRCLFILFCSLLWMVMWIRVCRVVFLFGGSLVKRFGRLFCVVGVVLVSVGEG